MKIYPTILCGGSGTRLWPLSRQSYPKQFVRLIGDESLFQASARRLSGPDFAAPLVLTNSDFRFIVTEQLSAVGIDPGAVLIEAEGRNTAPAVLAAALHVLDRDRDAVLLVAPSDHVIPDTAGFHAAVKRGLGAVRDGRIVTFGITPTRPETGYGYLELADRPDASGAPIPLRGFVEKPDAARARAMISAGSYLWNAGIFLFRAADMVAAFEACAPEVLAPVRAALTGARPDLGFLRLAPDAWAQAPDISLDYAVMERADNLSVVPFGGAWSDLGGWDAVWAEGARDADGLGQSGRVSAIDCTDSLLRSDSAGTELVGIGLHNIIAVAMDDAVLIADKSRAQDVRQAVDVLRARSAPQAVRFLMDHRPWGYYETLALGPRFQVKRIVVHPGSALSLQSHHHRSEHWIVVEGTARVTVGAEVRLVTENQSVYIPLGARHRLENPGKVAMVLIEVQTGTYLGEDDIVRFEDNYARAAKAAL
ncbi:MAG: mannose-1-phosphate guanylyltransferase/mannose-6-phosphate isomerase [Rhodobacteraceae bacterium]|nr:mannose-1-phosphate guanylyltransferase/mannose-6-phosphate isomerase [Paracoccaceae bacterium]